MAWLDISLRARVLDAGALLEEGRLMALFDVSLRARVLDAWAFSEEGRLMAWCVLSLRARVLDAWALSEEGRLMAWLERLMADGSWLGRLMADGAANGSRNPDGCEGGREACCDLGAGRRNVESVGPPGGSQVARYISLKRAPMALKFARFMVVGSACSSGHCSLQEPKAWNLMHKSFVVPALLDMGGNPW